MKKLYSILSLTRLYVFLPFTFLIILWGFEKINNSYELKQYLLTCLSFLFALISAFSINDIEDSIDDLSSEYPRNPISLGYLSLQESKIIYTISCFLSILFSYFSSKIILRLVFFILVITFLYSWKKVRLKTIPPFDVIIHFSIFGLIFLGGSWTKVDQIIINNRIIFSWLSISTIGMIALLTHQVYEFKGDKNAGIRTTATILGFNLSIIFIALLSILLLFLMWIEISNNYIPIKSVIIFTCTSISIMLFPLVKSKNNRISLSKKMFPWALNIGALAAIIQWIFNT